MGFWDELVSGYGSTRRGSLDDFLAGQPSKLRGLTDKGRASSAIQLPVQAGTRIAFQSNIGSVLSYPHPPNDGALGTVVMVRTADGDRTDLNGLVFVKFDHGQFLAVNPEHMRFSNQGKTARSVVRRVASLGDLSGFIRSAQAENDLIHRATQDLWKYEETPEGFVISRLFKETGSPLKV